MFEISILFYGMFAVLCFGAVLALFNSLKNSKTDHVADRPAAIGLAASLPLQSLSRSAFATSQDQGNYGEALTFIAMSARGFRPLNSKLGGGRGIDGIFIKDKGAGFAAVLVETKTGQSTYSDKQMSHEKLLADLDALYVTAGDAQQRAAYAAIAEGLRAHAAHIQKELWRHDLETGQTRAVSLSHTGMRTGRARLMDLTLASEALSAALKEFDRTGHYIRP